MLQKINGQYEVNQEVIDKLVEWETQIKEIKKFQDEYKAKLLEEIEKVGCTKLENEKIRINYIEPTYRETFDSTTFKKRKQRLIRQIHQNIRSQKFCKDNG